MSNRKERILEMEKVFKEAEHDPERANELMEELEEIINRISKLAKYAREHLSDDMMWEKENPIPLRESTTGILSEDGIYNLLGEEYQRSIKLYELGLKIQKSL